MNIKNVLDEYDAMFTVKSIDEIARFLEEQTAIAEKEADKAAILTLLNEQIGLFREMKRRDEALKACIRILSLADEMDILGSLAYAKTILNLANAYREFSLYDESEYLFRETELIFSKSLPKEAYDYAPLYNNWSLLAIEVGDIEKGCELIRRAIKVVDKYEAAVINQASSRVNLASALLELDDKHINNEKYIEEAGICIEEAIGMFESQGGNDYHFASALSLKGDLFMRLDDYKSAMACYLRAKNIIASHIGNNYKTEVLNKKIRLAEERSVL